MKGLQLWMRIVGSFFLLSLVGSLPPIANRIAVLQYPRLEGESATFAYRALIVVLFEGGLMVGAIGLMLLLAARTPARHLVLVQTVLAIAFVHLVLGHWYGYISGLETLTDVVSCAVIDLAILVTGLATYRKAASTAASAAMRPA